MNNGPSRGRVQIGTPTICGGGWFLFSVFRHASRLTLRDEFWDEFWDELGVRRGRFMAHV